MPVFIHYQNNVPGVRIQLDTLPLHIGRDETNELCLDDDLASRQHAVVERVEGQSSKRIEYVLRDNQSTNGTFVNGEKIISHLLTDGDMVRIGRSFFKFLANTQAELGETKLLKKTLLPGVFYTTEKPR